MIRFFPASAQHVGSRENQQDAFGFSEAGDELFAAHGGFLAIVCDGMGGLALGDQASQIAVKTFIEAYAAKPPEETIPQALERSARSANAAVLNLAISAGTPGEVGTTLVAATYQPEGLHWISVGDSALFLYREERLIQLNTYHTYANILDVRAFRGEITRELAFADPQREALTSYVGARELREIDANIRPFPVQHGDVFVLASDGLFKTLPQDQIVSTITEGPENAAGQLVSNTLAVHRQYQDNVTVCTVRVVDPDRKPAAVPTRSKKKLADTLEISTPARASKKVAALAFIAAATLVGAVMGGYFYYQRHVAAKGPPHPPAHLAQPPQPGPHPAEQGAGKKEPDRTPAK